MPLASPVVFQSYVQDAEPVAVVAGPPSDVKVEQVKKGETLIYVIDILSAQKES